MTLADLVGPPPASAPEALAALAHLPRLRVELDALERGLIDAARRSGASWTDIAGALKLRSRQAAEQRRLRLDRAGTDPLAVRARRRGQRSVDSAAGAAVAALRAAASELADALQSAASTPTLDLAGSTLRIASDAEPGGLIDLTRWTLADLDTAASLPAAVADRAAAVRAIIESMQLKIA